MLQLKLQYFGHLTWVSQRGKKKRNKWPVVFGRAGKAKRPARPERGGPGRPGFAAWWKFYQIFRDKMI